MVISNGSEEDLFFCKVRKGIKMDELKNVLGSKTHAKSIIVDVDTVYIHKNVNKLANGMYEYDEQQFSKDEFLVFLYEKVIQLEKEMREMRNE